MTHANKFYGQIIILLTCIYDVQMYCVAVVVSAICYALLRLNSLHIKGYPHPFSIGTGFSTLDQDSRSYTIKVSIYICTHTCPHAHTHTHTHTHTLIYTSLPCGRLPCLFYTYSGYGEGPLSCRGILMQDHEIPQWCWLYIVPQ